MKQVPGIIWRLSLNRRSLVHDPQSPQMPAGALDMPPLRTLGRTLVRRLLFLRCSLLSAPRPVGFAPQGPSPQVLWCAMTASAPICCATCGATHRYDCPCIGPVQFLQAVMHDPTVPIRDRMYAADKIMRLANKGIWPEFREPSLHYKIDGITIQ